MAKPTQLGSSLQVWMHRPASVELCARGYSRGKRRPFQAAEPAWALREETHRHRARWPAGSFRLCWEVLLTLNSSSLALLSAGAPKGLGEAQAGEELCKLSLCLCTCSGVCCLGQEKDTDANQFMNRPEYATKISWWHLSGS